MKLRKIYFDAFKSILDSTLEINDNCIGFVGINESGKSNVLKAIQHLDINNEMTILDTARMAKDRNPSLRFEFEPNKKIKESVISAIKDWCVNNTLIEEEIIDDNFHVIYNVYYDKKIQQEIRNFHIEGIRLSANYLILKEDKITDDYLIKKGEAVVPLSKAIIISKDIIFENKDLLIRDKERLDIIKQLRGLESEIQELKSATIKDVEAETKTEEQKQTDVINNDNEKQIDDEKIHEKEQKIKDIALKEKLLEDLKHELEKFNSELNGYNLFSIVNTKEEELVTIEEKINKLNDTINQIRLSIKSLEAHQTPTPEQTTQLTENKNNLSKSEAQLKSFVSKKMDVIKFIENIKESLDEKYTDDISELFKYLKILLKEILQSKLPAVVFWENNDNHILQSETLFSEIVDKTDLRDISRPLVNIFRIGLKIENFDDLKQVVNEIQTDKGERTRLADRLTLEINDYIKSIWNEYTQKIKISLEQERILIQFFDPDYRDASYYSMEERSQGCKSFISFLLTVGAEASHKVIKNTILLLDEPETHLHPSGVRYMLQELLKIADHGNNVFYATHSIFMIDRDKYDRHVILKKEKEKTILQPAVKDRIGFFMQEEVLYNTLDINLSKEFNSMNMFNFVFEGEGDTDLFQKYYTLLSKEQQPFDIKNTSFYHGGKCSDIIKYFSYKPIQLGSKWIFVLDSDKPADELKKFIEKKYKLYLNKDVFIFQYSKNTMSQVELEDILSSEIIENAAIKSLKELEIEHEPASVAMNERTFGEYIKDNVIKFPDERFKALFKENLNKSINEHIIKCKTMDNFKSTFAIYYEWVENVINLINQSIDKSLDTDKPEKKKKELKNEKEDINERNEE